METLLKDLLFAVITAAIPVLTYYLSVYLGKIFKKIDAEVDSDSAREILDNVYLLISQVVARTSQTYVDSLKASGSFNKEAQEKAFNDSKDIILSLLSEKSKQLIESLYGEVDRWLDVQIEAAVRQNKIQ